MRRTRRAVIPGVAALAVFGPATTATAAGPAVTASAPASVPAAACQPWNGVQPATGSTSVLYGVTMASSCGAWAVGATGGPQQTLALRWNGPTWTRLASPDGSAGSNSLSSVAATSARNAWAVGNYAVGGTTALQAQALILRWNGSAWKRVRSPEPGGSAGFNGLFGVAAASARNAWAVGSYGNGTARQTLIVHWNGRSWKRVPSPDPAGRSRDNKLTSVAVLSATDAWAVGYDQTARAYRQTLVLHWNGRDWRHVPSPDPGSAHVGLLFGVAATAARSAWAVGYYRSAGGGYDTLVLYWNGRAWKRVPSPDPSSGRLDVDQLLGVAATSARSAWAVGYYQPADGAADTLVLHWNGRAWKRVPSPDPGAADQGNSLLVGVAAASASDAWAVGNFDGSSGATALALHWNGTAWQQ